MQLNFLFFQKLQLNSMLIKEQKISNNILKQLVPSRKYLSSQCLLNKHQNQNQPTNIISIPNDTNSTIQSIIYPQVQQSSTSKARGRRRHRIKKILVNFGFLSIPKFWQTPFLMLLGGKSLILFQVFITKIHQSLQINENLFSN